MLHQVPSVDCVMPAHRSADPGGFRQLRHRIKAYWWRQFGRRPNAAGSTAAKWAAIESALSADDHRSYGFDAPGIDERVVEYSWIFDRIRALMEPDTRILDAGSILNHALVTSLWRRHGLPQVSIVTLAYEGSAFASQLFRYEFADLRRLPYRDEWFSVVLCISTLEHVGLDTTIYGVTGAAASDPNAQAASAIRELYRVTRQGGRLLLSVPFGAASNRDWLRVMDHRDLSSVLDHSAWTHVSTRFFRATSSGWRECSRSDVEGAGYNEPANRGQRTAPPFVAAAEAVALVELVRT